MPLRREVKNQNPTALCIQRSYTGVKRPISSDLGSKGTDGSVSTAVGDQAGSRCGVGFLFAIFFWPYCLCFLQRLSVEHSGTPATRLNCDVALWVCEFYTCSGVGLNVLCCWWWRLAQFGGS